MSSGEPEWRMLPSAASMQEIAQQFTELDLQGVIEVGLLHQEILAHWPAVASHLVVITGERKHYFVGKHQEIESLSVELVRTVVDPDEIHLDKLSETTAVLWRAIGDGYRIRVVLSLSQSPNLGNSVINAWRVRARDFDRAVRRAEGEGKRLWRRA